MKKRILETIGKTEKLLSGPDTDCVDWEEIRQEFLVKLEFYRHERLVHLLVMMLVAVLMVLTLGISIIGDYFLFIVVPAALFALLIPYVLHYYFLENSVQKMYDLYDRILEKLGKETLK